MRVLLTKRGSEGADVYVVPGRGKGLVPVLLKGVRKEDISGRVLEAIEAARR